MTRVVAEATAAAPPAAQKEDAMIATGRCCTRNGGLALACTALIPSTGNWLARAFC
jgi:hypothetical protein